MTKVAEATGVGLMVVGSATGVGGSGSCEAGGVG